MPAMYVAGLPIPGPDVLELARLVDGDPLADRLESAYGRDVRVFGLDVRERELLLRTLDDPAALAELRAVLLQEHVGRVRDGLA